MLLILFNLLKCIVPDKPAKMCKRLLLFLIISVAIAVSCKNFDRRDVSIALYANYSIRGEEGKEFVTAFFQFFDDPVERALVLREPAKIFLDDNLLSPDSAKETGGFYEMQIPIQDFTGAHTIRFIDAENREHREEFSFTPFRLTNEVRDSFNRKDMVFRIEGLEDQDIVRVVITDTSFESEGVNEMDTILNQRLDLRKYLPAISNGPVTLYLFKEEERSLENKPSKRGTISITYSLKREFELKD
jgi:hypothetical protein